MTNIQLGAASLRDLFRTLLHARIVAFLLGATVALPTAVRAEEEPLPDRFTVKTGGFAARSIGTTVPRSRLTLYKRRHARIAKTASA